MLQAWDVSYQPDSAESGVFYVLVSLWLCLTILALYLWSVLFFFLSWVLNVVKNPLLTKAQSMHVTALVMYPQHLRKANRIWQKTGWNWKCSNLLKAAGRGSNNWPQLVNKPNVFTEQHRRWKKTEKKKACKSWHNKYIYITGHI